MPNTLTNGEELSLLLQLADSALPTGAFSHSFGLESPIVAGLIGDEDSLQRWLRSYVETQLLCSEALAMRWIYEGQDPARVHALLAAATVAPQVRLANRRMGAQLIKLAPQIDGTLGTAPLQWPEHFALGFALFGKHLGLDFTVLVQVFLHSSVTTLVQNAVRAIPLGQLAGQRVLSALRPAIAAAAVKARTLNEREFGSAAPGLEIAQLRHEHQSMRMFMS
ncbi:urease accessory protein UreF [Glutamicibacter endophyticus]